MRNLILILLAGCATEIAERPPALDPASPRAEEAPAARVATLPAHDPTLASQEAPLHHAQPPASTYTCPMHREVRSDKPGNCPKCGMKLVPLEKSP